MNTNCIYCDNPDANSSVDVDANNKETGEKVEFSVYLCDICISVFEVTQVPFAPNCSFYNEYYEEQVHSEDVADKVNEVVTRKIVNGFDEVEIQGNSQSEGDDL